MRFFSNLRYDLKNNKVLFIMLAPAIIYFFIFNYIPMTGIIIAFKNLDYTKGIFGSEWVGFKNFEFFFKSGQAMKVTVNTVLYNIAFIVSHTVVQLSLAIFLSELGNKYFKKITQGAMFLPYFISWVVASAMVYNIFNYDFGTLNTALKNMGASPVDVYSKPDLWKYLLVFFHLWKGVGYGTVIYLAAIMNIDQEMYEAADLDGANIFQKAFMITIPCLKPTIIVLTLLGIGNIFRGDFGMFWNLVGNNGMLFDTTDVIDTFVFRSMMCMNDFSIAAASGIYQSVLSFITLSVVNKIVKKIDKEYALY